MTRPFVEALEAPETAINAAATRGRFDRYLEATYDEYVMRGESEDRNEEPKCGLAMDRLSNHRFVADYFRLYLHAGRR